MCRSCNVLSDLSNKVCVPNKIEDLNLSVFNIITGINESKTLTKIMLGILLHVIVKMENI